MLCSWHIRYRRPTAAAATFDCLMGWCGLDDLRPSGSDHRRVEPADAHRRSGKGNPLRQGWVASLARRLRDRFAAAPGPDIVGECCIPGGGGVARAAPASYLAVCTLAHAGAPGGGKRRILFPELRGPRRADVSAATLPYRKGNCRSLPAISP